MNYGLKKIFINNYTFYVSKEVYEPAEDTLLVAENMVVQENTDVLDMGTGCGVFAILAAKNAKKVVALDINAEALSCTRKNAIINKVSEKIETRLSNLFSALNPTEKFHLIVFNAPYLPVEPNEDIGIIEKAWCGGTTGRTLIDKFISDSSNYLVKGGRILLVQSTLSNPQDTLKSFSELGYNVKIIGKKKVDFEEILLIEAQDTE